MPPFNVLLVGQEKELQEMQPMVEAARRAVGPIRVHAAFKAVDGVSKLTGVGRMDVAMLSHHFTNPGKEQFSEALRNTLKDKHPDVPVICWGKPDRGGKKGEHFHHALEEPTPATVAAMLAKVQSGELVSEYGGKKGKAPPGAAARKSSDERRKSMDAGSNGGSMRRQSLEESGMPSAGSMRRQSMEREGPGLASMGSMGRANAAMVSMGSMTGHMGPGLASMGSMQHNSLGSMGMGMGMMGNGMSPMMDGGSMSPSMGFGGLAQAPSFNRLGSMTPMTGMMTPMPTTALLQPQLGYAGTGSPIAMPPSAFNALGGQVAPAPAAPSLCAAAPAGALAPAASANTELIKMLSSEVQRLRAAVTEKRRRESIDMNNGSAVIPVAPAVATSLQFV